MSKNNVIVVGGGPGGILAALSAADQGDDVMLLEKNEKIGKKLYITGKGRCNLTNTCDDEEFFKNVVHNSRFMFSSMNRFNRYDLMNLVEDSGCPLKEERGGRVFPQSDKSSDVIKAFRRALEENSVDIRLNTEIEKIITDEEGKTALGVQTADGKIYHADRIVLATGGISYPSTGSDGKGMALAEGLGHHIVPCRPSLIGLRTVEDWPERGQGLTLKNVEASLYYKEKKIKTLRGEMMLTHFGISGPIILTLSALMDGKPSDYAVAVDLKPALDDKQLDQRIVRDFGKNKNRDLHNALSELLPSKMIPIVIEEAGIAPDKKVNQISKAERKSLGQTLKHLTCRVADFYDSTAAIVTAGGVDVSEINPKTMESKLVSHLYFAGEMIDVDGLTGGFNIQIAASTGFSAGAAGRR